MPWLLTRNRGWIPARAGIKSRSRRRRFAESRKRSIAFVEQMGVAKTANIVDVLLACVSQLPKPEMATSLGDCCRKERKDSGCNRNNQEESSVDVRTRSMGVNPYCRAYSGYILWRGVGFSLCASERLTRRFRLLPLEEYNSFD
jgi:hypothetical protein